MSTATGWRWASARLCLPGTRWLLAPERKWVSVVGPRLVDGIEAATGAGWRTEEVTFTSTRVAVVTVAAPGSARRFVVKVPWTAESAENLRRQVGVLAALHADPRLGSLSRVMPRCVGHGVVDGRCYWVEEALPGVSASAIVRSRPSAAAVLGLAARLIHALHVHTRESTLIDDALIEAWVNAPMRRLAAFPASQHRPDRLLNALNRLREELVGTLNGRVVRTSWIHGDFWPGNVLVTQPGSRVTGVVDWDQAAPRQLPLHDLLHLHVFSRRLVTGDELGAIVVRALHDGIGAAIGVPAGQVDTWLDGIPQRQAVLLYWLRHVVLFIDSEGHHDNPRWLRANVERVLANA